MRNIIFPTVRYICVLAALSVTCFITWTAVIETMAGYFDPWMVFACGASLGCAYIANFGLKSVERTLTN